MRPHDAAPALGEGGDLVGDESFGERHVVREHDEFVAELFAQRDFFVRRAELLQPIVQFNTS